MYLLIFLQIYVNMNTTFTIEDQPNKTHYQWSTHLPREGVAEVKKWTLVIPATVVVGGGLTLGVGADCKYQRRRDMEEKRKKGVGR